MGNQDVPKNGNAAMQLVRFPAPSGWSLRFRSRVANAAYRLAAGEKPEEIREDHGIIVLHEAQEVRRIQPRMFTEAPPRFLQR